MLVVFVQAGPRTIGPQGLLRARGAGIAWEWARVEDATSEHRRRDQ